jgi:plasmid stability protein
MATLQVRSIDDQLYEALGRRAAMDNRSISQEVTVILKKYLSSPPSASSRNTEDFLALCGSWQDERNADDIIKEIRRDRRSAGRFSEDVF